jgi:hypothetical protein
VYGDVLCGHSHIYVCEYVGQKRKFETLASESEICMYHVVCVFVCVHGICSFILTSESEICMCHVVCVCVCVHGICSFILVQLIGKYKHTYIQAYHGTVQTGNPQVRGTHDTHTHTPGFLLLP